MFIAGQVGGKMATERFPVERAAFRLDDGNEFTAEIRMIQSEDDGGMYAGMRGQRRFHLLRIDIVAA